MLSKNSKYLGSEPLGGDERGFTLIEIVAALVITVGLVLAVYKSYELFIKIAACSDLKVTAQQDARAAIEMISSDLKLIGYGIPEKDPDTREVIPAVVKATPGELTVRFKDPDGGSAMGADHLLVTYKVGGAPHYPLIKSVCQASDHNDSGSSCVEDGFIGNLDPAADGGGLYFTYYNVEGEEIMPWLLVSPDDIRDALFSIIEIEVKLGVRSEKECIKLDGTTGYASLVLETRSLLRNRNPMKIR